MIAGERHSVVHSPAGPARNLIAEASRVATLVWLCWVDGGVSVHELETSCQKSETLAVGVFCNLANNRSQLIKNL